MKAQDETGFKIAIRDLKRCFKQLEIKSEYLMEIERRAYYLSNEYSEKDTREQMQSAKH
ncbi:MAG: hypothetical protein HFH48_06535 [Lachnospiraceae bacterium]|nr:hypothetical protein [Lachnospiraceae bacterium]